MVEWFLYIVKCADNSLYTGITTDLERRIEEHNGDNQLGARYTRPRRPVTLVYKECCAGRSEAAKREYEIKKLGREEKERLISKGTLT
ncbi:MAG: GIY-YIG nuclease family protein [Deltaproteobacteria bacterium]|nr:GIY-YIG nuclease family protein [Deltaproteobacteria bacterium]